MSLLKSFLLGAVTLVAILAIISICLPSRIHIQRDIVIHAPAEDTYRQISELRNWSNWLPWHLNEPEMEVTYSGPPGGAGAQYRWVSKSSEEKAGAVTIVAAEPHKRIVTNLELRENDVASGTFTLEPIPEGTKLTWYLDKYTGRNLISKFGGLLVNSTVGEDFEKGLENLKKEVESRQALSEE